MNFVGAEPRASGKGHGDGGFSHYPWFRSSRSGTLLRFADPLVENHAAWRITGSETQS